MASKVLQESPGTLEAVAKGLLGIEGMEGMVQALRVAGERARVDMRNAAETKRRVEAKLQVSLQADLRACR